MKKISLLLSIGFFLLFTGFLVFSITSTKAADEQKELSYDANLCLYQDENGKVINIYNNPELSTMQIMTLYHTNVNDTFNEYIRYMIAAEAATNGVNEYSIPPENDEDCVESRANYSTYCVARNLISDREQGDGYIQYAQALSCQRGQLFESTKEETLWDDWIEASTCLGGVQGVIPPEGCDPEEEARLEEEIGGVLQSQRALQISARLDAIDREIKTSKRALDQTLSAYNELKTAWPMHKKYMEIYSSLEKYRNKLVELRHQVEEFPGKFIDATTTKCT